MPKKKIIEEEMIINEPEPAPEVTKPVKAKANKKVFKDTPQEESPASVDSDLQEFSETAPVKKRSKKANPVVSPEAAEIADNVNLDDSAAPKKIKRAKWVWLGILIMIVIAAIGSAFGYYSALQVRKAEETAQKLEAATTQYVLAEQDQAAGNLTMALQRLEYIMTVYPEYPGLDAKLTEVMLANSIASPETVTSVQTTPEAAITQVATVDTTKVNVLFSQAQSQLAATDWSGLLDSVNQLRNIDPTYEAVEVDGMYYYALRYNGIAKIQAGELEVGLYYFAMAEQIAPLDNGINEWRTWAEAYQDAACWYGVNWEKAIENFRQVASQVPNLIDSSGVTAKQRYIDSYIGLGDVLMTQTDYCSAAIAYQSAKDILVTDALLTKFTLATDYCANPPATPTPTEDPNQPTPTPTVDSYNPTG